MPADSFKTLDEALKSKMIVLFFKPKAIPTELPAE
jgi:hypothetical protein